MAGDPKQFSKYGAKRAELDRAWRDRLDDADALFNAGRHAAAIAAGLYAVEIYLKVRICKKLGLDSLPRAFEFHDLDGLFVLTGLSRRLNTKKMLRSKVKRSWDSILEISNKMNDLRYSPASNWSRSHAEAFLTQLRDPNDGVLTWLSKQR
jgi:hypothetical protein